jgi:hypothetical protein
MLNVAFGSALKSLYFAAIMRRLTMSVTRILATHKKVPPEIHNSMRRERFAMRHNARAWNLRSFRHGRKDRLGIPRPEAATSIYLPSLRDHM